jgi:hypothetical protein
MRASIPIALLTAGAVASHSLPAQALPAARMNLVRIDAQGVQPLPDLTRLLREVEAAQEGQAPAGSPAAAAPVMAQAVPTGSSAGAEAAAGSGIFFLPSGNEDLRIRFSVPLPAGADGELLLRAQRAPWKAATSGPDAGEVVERIPLGSNRVRLSDDRRYLQIDPERPVQAGEVITVDFTALSATPQPETPVRFALPETACLFLGPERTGQGSQQQGEGSQDSLLGKEDDSVVLLLSPGDDLEISFTTPLPGTLRGTLVLRDQPAPGDKRVSGPPAGEVVERIDVASSQVFRSEDGLFMAITPQSRRTLGWITTVDLSELSAAAAPETPQRFTLARPACPIPRRASPCPIAPLPSANPAAVSGVAVGIAVVGVIAGVVVLLAGGGGGGKKNGGGTPSR